MGGMNLFCKEKSGVNSLDFVVALFCKLQVKECGIMNCIEHLTTNKKPATERIFE